MFKEKIFISAIIIFKIFSLYSLESDTQNKFSFDVAVLQPEMKGDPFKGAESFMEQINAYLNVYGTHQLTKDEKEALEKRVDDEYYEKIYKDIDNLLNQRDKLVYSKNSRSTYKNLSDKIADKKKLLEEYSGTVIEADEIGINILAPGENKKLFSYEDEKLSEADFLVSATMIRSSDILKIIVEYENRLTGEKGTLYSNSGDISDYREWIEETDKSLRTHILGRKWCAVKIETYPGDAMIYKEEKLLGIGKMYARSLVPGKKVFKIVREGFVPQNIEVSLEPGETGELKIELDEKEVRQIAISTVPPDADIYLGSIWMGQTPLLIPEPSNNISVLIKKEGYRQVYKSSSELDNSAGFALKTSDNNSKDRVETSRRKFYNSAAIFTVSILFPVIMHGVMENRGILYESYLNEYQLSSIEKNYNRLDPAYKSYERSYYTYNTAIGVSGSLLAFTLYRLGVYIRTAEDSILEE